MSPRRLCQWVAIAAAMFGGSQATALLSAEPENAPQAEAQRPATPAETPLVGYDFSRKIDFKLGEAQLREGDMLTIDEVTGTADTISPRNLYLVKGRYRLASADRLAINVRFDEPLGPMPTQKTQGVTIDRGESRFSLIFCMWTAGRPHISLHPTSKGAGGGPAFADVPFGSDPPQPAGQRQDGEKNSAKPGNPQAKAMAAALVQPMVDKIRRERDALAGRIEALQIQLFELDKQLNLIEQQLDKAGDGGR